MRQEPVYNPLDKQNLGTSVAEALLAKQAEPLSELTPFKGAGVYALYYEGDFRAYKKLSTIDTDHGTPIYVGKAVPAGARKGYIGLGLDPGTVLYRRLKEHADSIRAVDNLKIEDFTCRFLVVDDIWIPLGESLLIARYSPLWNSLIDGFGNHDPGRGRYAGLRPRWDTLHPGRTWAQKCQVRPETQEQIEQEVIAYLKQLQ